MPYELIMFLLISAELLLLWKMKSFLQLRPDILIRNWQWNLALAKIIFRLKLPSRTGAILAIALSAKLFVQTSSVYADTPFTSFSFPATLPSGSGTTPASRTTPQREGVYASVKDFGAIGDGTGALLNTRYGSLAAAQAVYPFVTNIATQTIDWAAIQAAIKWTGTTTSVGCVFLPYGTYIVADPINFGSDITLSVCFLGVGVGSTIQTTNAGLPGQAVLSRTTGPTNNSSIITIEKLQIVNYGVLGCAIQLGVSSQGAAIRDCFIHADIGISCGEFVNPTQVTSATTTSGTTLTFAAGVPQLVIDNFNNAHGTATAVSNVTTPNSISGGATVAGVTSTTVTLSSPVAGTVGNGDTIQFTWTQQESVRGAWDVVIERVHCEAHRDYIPGSFGIAIIENSIVTSVDMNTYDHAIRVCGVGNVITAPHIETCRKAIVLGMMPNGVLQTGSNYKISGLGAESNGIGIDFVSSFGAGVIEGSGMNAAQYAVPYMGNPVSGIAVTGSLSGATGTASVEYNMARTQWEITLTAVTGTFVHSGETATVNTTQATSSNTVLTFAGGVPAAVQNVANNGHGGSINVFDLTSSPVTFLGNVVSATSTTVTVSQTVTVGNGDSIQFNFGGDNIGDGTNIPKFTNIGAFVSGSGGSGTICAGLSGQAEYGLHGSTKLGNTVISGSGFQGYYNQAAIDFEGGNGGANVTFLSSFAVNNIVGRPAWITPQIAGDAQYINCNLDQPEYAFNNLRPYPFGQRGDEFFVTNSSVSTFNGTVDGAGGAGATHVKAVASKIVTGVTNAGTSIGSAVIHFASTPAGIVNGMVIGSSGRITTGLQPYPDGTIVTGQTGTTVTVSNTATAAILTGDTIGFVQWTVH